MGHVSLYPFSNYRNKNTLQSALTRIITAFSSWEVGLLANYRQFLEVQLFQKFCIFVCKNVQFNVNGAHPSLLGS